jgi:hypothetical protein
MPSYQDPSTILTGPGRVHVDVVSAAADLYSTGSSATLAQLAAVIAQPLASPSSKVYTAGVSGDTTRVMAASDGPFYIGDNVSDDIQDLFKVVTAADDTDIFNSNTQQYVRISAISPSVIGGGFGTVALTLTFSTPVPANLQYRVYYGRRVTVASLPVEMNSNPMIRRTPNRVRFPEFDRTGYAPTSISPEQNYSSTGYPDPYLAQWKAKLRGTISPTGNSDTSYGGALGFVHIGHCRHVLDSRDAANIGLPGAAILNASEKDIRVTVFPGGNAALTRVNSTLLGTVANPNIVNLNGSDYFLRNTPTPQTAIRIGVDMVEVTFANGSKGVYVITAFGATPNQAIVATLGGGSPNFTNGSASFKWIRPSFFTGAVQEEFSSEIVGGPFELRGASFLSPGSITTLPDQEIAHAGFFFAAGTPNPARAGTDDWNFEAMSWGAYQDTGTDTPLGEKLVNGALLGDGSVESYGGRVRGLISKRSRNFFSFFATSPYVWDPYSTSVLGILFGGSTAKILTLTLDPGYTPQDGDSLEVIVWNSDTSGLGWQSTIVWPPTFKFSGTDADISGVSPGSVYMKFVGTYMDGTCYFTRTDYEA